MAAADYTNLVQALYVSYFGRPADTHGLANFSAALSAANAPTDMNGLVAAYAVNPTVKALINSFGASAESAALYTGGTLEFVNAIYQNIFGRTADLDGLLFWSNAIDNGTLSRGNAALNIAAGAFNNAGSDAQILTNKIEAATNFTNAIDSAIELNGYSGNEAAALARSYLSTVTDHVPDSTVTQNTLTQIVYLTGINTPKPVAVTSTIANYGSAIQQITLDADSHLAPVKNGSVPGFSADVLSYAISSNGEITFSGTFANALTPEQKAGDILAILNNMPGATCSFVQYNPQTQQNDTYLVVAGSATSGPAVIDIVGVTQHGVSGLNIHGPMHWSFG